MPVRNLREFLDLLRREGDLVEVGVPVDPYLEIAEIHRRVIAAGGPALLFTRPVGAGFPVVTNLFGTARRIELAFGPRPERFVRDVDSAKKGSIDLDALREAMNRRMAPPPGFGGPGGPPGQPPRRPSVVPNRKEEDRPR